MKINPIAAGCMLAMFLLTGHAQMTRFKPLTENDMTDAQRKAAQDLASGPRGRLNPSGPNALLLRSPDLMSRTQRVGEYLRYNSSLPTSGNCIRPLIGFARTPERSRLVRSGPSERASFWRVRRTAKSRKV